MQPGDGGGPISFPRMPGEDRSHQPFERTGNYTKTLIDYRLQVICNLKMLIVPMDPINFSQ